ncbi:MAG: thioredoxin family protein [Armatimonadetes bacterium]|nr:thioredoxin family protein [Armatimonadota bacterium]
MKKLLPLFALMLMAIPVFAQDHKQVHPVDHVLAAANKQAKAEGKNVMVMFHASWCTWCHRMDDWLTKNEQGKMVAKSVVIVHITVLEDEKHKADENPGGAELLEKLGGAKTGIPFFAILTPEGKMLANSNPNEDKPGNIGFPVEKDEIAHFIKMLKIGTKLSGDQLEAASKSLWDNGAQFRRG